MPITIDAVIILISNDFGNKKEFFRRLLVQGFPNNQKGFY